MSEQMISREKLHAYLDDGLSETEMADVEKALRESEDLQKRLSAAMQERDRGEHTLGAIWRRERLTCPNRETLQQYILEILDDAEQDYITFHLNVIGCPFCQANHTDLLASHHQSENDQARRRRMVKSTSSSLPKNEVDNH